MIITGGEYNGRKMLAPNEKITRPTLSKVRMGVFNTLYSMLENFEGKSFLDLFGGSGIMGLEALSRGFEKVFVIEKNKKSAEIIEKNYHSLNLKPNLFIGDSLKYIKNPTEYFDVIYVDPPYQSGIYSDVLDCITKSFPPNTIVIAEHSDSLESTALTTLKVKNYGGTFVSFFITK